MAKLGKCHEFRDRGVFGDRRIHVRDYELDQILKRQGARGDLSVCDAV